MASSYRVGGLAALPLLLYTMMCFISPPPYASAFLLDYTAIKGNATHLLYHSPTVRRVERVPLRILPLGASIMYGIGSSTGNGYVEMTVL